MRKYKDVKMSGPEEEFEKAFTFEQPAEEISADNSEPVFYCFG